MTNFPLEESANKLIEKLFGPAAETLGLILSDWARVWRYKNLIAVSKRIEEIEKRRGAPIADGRIEPRIGIPVIEAVSLEDNVELQDLWANLIYESLAQDGQNPGFSRTLLRIARDLEPSDVPILRYIYNQGLNRKGEHQIVWVESSTIRDYIERIAYANGADDGIIRRA